MEMGRKKVTVINSHDGMDEVSIYNKTDVAEYDAKTKQIKCYTVSPSDYDTNDYKISGMIGGTITGGDSKYNSTIFKKLLSESTNPVLRDYKNIVLLNSGFAFYTAEAVNNVPEGIILARKLLDEGTTDKFYKDYSAISFPFR
jgi:anthranilate phosphoribosyltransferase